MTNTAILWLFVCLMALVCGCSGSREDPKEFPPELISKVTGKATLQTETNAWLTLAIYNGTERNLAAIDVLLENKKSRVQRVFRFEVTTTASQRNEGGQVIGTTRAQSSVRPFSEMSFEGYIGDFLSGATGPEEWSWSITGVQGFK